MYFISEKRKNNNNIQFLIGTLHTILSAKFVRIKSYCHLITVKSLLMKMYLSLLLLMT